MPLLFVKYSMNGAACICGNTVFDMEMFSNDGNQFLCGLNPKYMVWDLSMKYVSTLLCCCLLL